MMPSHYDEQSHGHGYSCGLSGHNRELRGSSDGGLTSELVLIVSYRLSEVMDALRRRSLGRIADAGHMLPDGGSISFALAAVNFSILPGFPEPGYEYRRLPAGDVRPAGIRRNR